MWSEHTDRAVFDGDIEVLSRYLLAIHLSRRLCLEVQRELSCALELEIRHSHMLAVFRLEKCLYSL